MLKLFIPSRNGNINPLQAELPNAEPRKHRITIYFAFLLRHVFNINEFPIKAHNHKVLSKYSRRIWVHIHGQQPSESTPES
jgi:hypothetical protein